jgi:hypothetical protein
MRIIDIPVPNSRLIEGTYHYFKILKETDIGDEKWYVMQDPLGYKVLMPSGFYAGYGFLPGNEVLCRVDRINCNGRMFLEPMHPHYREGEIYDFAITGKFIKTGLTGDTEFYVRVFDILQNEWDVRFFEENIIQQNTKTLRCKLERIKKGKLYLSLSSDHQPDYLQDGEIYDFLILEEKTDVHSRMKYFILQDEKGLKHILNKKYYHHYGLKKGQQINCRTDKFTSEGYYFLEPENPWYKIGEVYEFGLLEINRLIFSDATVQNVLVLDEPNSEPVKVMIGDDLEKFKNRSAVKCKITGFRKSRAELMVIED